MPARFSRNQEYLRNLFTGPFPGHALIMEPQAPVRPWEDDVSCPSRPVADWLPWALEVYEGRVKTHEAIGDDAVPYASVATGTGVFASAFGCPIEVFAGSNPAAMPIVRTAREADALACPTLDAEPLRRVLEFGELLRRRLGPEVPIGVPDVQSPFDIAALIWAKEEMFLALYDEPEAVKRLVAKCQRLLTEFLQEYARRVGPVNFCHCPYLWLPPELGMGLSEDEVGSLSNEQFAEFCLPVLTDLSRAFGGLYIHCCAAAEHQYREFRRIPNLRGLNRVFQAAGPKAAIETFSELVLVMAWISEEEAERFLAMSRPETRWVFNLSAPSLEESKRLYERLRERCPRV